MNTIKSLLKLFLVFIITFVYLLFTVFLNESFINHQDTLFFFKGLFFFTYCGAVIILLSDITDD